jgi:spore maturation protein CgeB
MRRRLNIVIVGLSITSSWGNGHASTYRGLVKGLAARGHQVLFLERDCPWYADNRDQLNPQGCRTCLYDSFEELVALFEQAIQDADLVILGSYVPEGIRVGRWIADIAKGRTAFYDIDTPVTLSLLESGTAEYVNADLIRRLHCYLSFTGGPTLRRVETQYGSPMARPLFCAVDTDTYVPTPMPQKWSLGYLGTYSEDRQQALAELLLEPARQLTAKRFAVVGPQYPEDIVWPANVDRMDHLAPARHPPFYGAQQFTLNVTRAPMKQAGFSPSVRLFEAGASATPVISDWWPGLDSIFDIGREILVCENAEDVLRILRNLSPAERDKIGMNSRARVLAEHSPIARARQIEQYFEEMIDNNSIDQARRHRRAWQDLGGIGPGMDAQSGRDTPGSSTQCDACKDSSGNGLHEPLGANSRNSLSDSGRAPITSHGG